MRQLVQNQTITLSLNTPFQITLEEPTYLNQQWEIVLPTGITLVKSHYSASTTKSSTLIRTWDLSAKSLGSYTITCHFRKNCCSHQIMQTATYRVNITA